LGSKGGDYLLDIGDLLGHLFGHGGAVGLVLVVHIVAEGSTLGIEYHGNLIGLFILYQFTQHIEDEIHNLGWLMIGASQIWSRYMVCTEQVGATVDQHQLFLFLLSHIDA